MTSTDTFTTFVVPGPHLMSALLGPRDQNLRQIEQQFPETHVSVRGNEISVRGGNSAQVGRLFEELVGLLEHGQELDERTIDRVQFVMFFRGIDGLTTAVTSNFDPRSVEARKSVEASRPGLMKETWKPIL